VLRGIADAAAGRCGDGRQVHAGRIGHGTRLFEDPRLRDYVRDRRIGERRCSPRRTHDRRILGRL
jgi:hypothetical protein